MPSRINLANVIFTLREWCVQKMTFKVSNTTYIFLLIDGSIVLLYEFYHGLLAVFYIISEFYQMRKKTLYFSMCLLGKRVVTELTSLYRE